MRVGVLVVGSLLWDERVERERWRESRLELDGRIQFPAPLRYGRTSSSRGNTFTMTIDRGMSTGRGVLIPCRQDVSTLKDLAQEAELLWAAESFQERPNVIGAGWGCVGAIFREEGERLAAEWSVYFKANGGKAIPPLTDDGALQMEWSKRWTDGAEDVDIILATATRPDSANPLIPDPLAVADRWADQSKGYEQYFFENVRNGIRTEDDFQIWQRLEARNPRWLSEKNEAIAILRREEGYGR